MNFHGFFPSSWFNHVKSPILLVESPLFCFDHRVKLTETRLLAGLEGGAAFGAATHFGEETGARLGHVFLQQIGKIVTRKPWVWKGRWIGRVENVYREKPKNDGRLGSCPV